MEHNRILKLGKKIEMDTYKVVADPELEAIRQRRMQELVAQRGGADERRQMMLSQILSSQAHERHE
ncbi:putative PDCD5-like superfamily protein [Helianthus annuus]|nr:putative PDCD5-like superfamily protein [Helianthus annuus]